MVYGKKRLLAVGTASWLTLATLGADPASAAGLLPNGDFEAGSLIGWAATERRDGITDLVSAGTCFSPEDTTRLTLFGNHAALVRSGPSGRRSSVGILTSDPFIAGDGIVFATLTGTRDGRRIVAPVHFEVRILTPDGDPLTSQRFNTSVVRLREGCPSEPRDGRFYVHYFDTRKFLDQEIRIQFRQNTNTSGIQPFTLIDQVIKFEKGEGPLFSSKPVAVASISQTRRGVLRLDASHSFDPDNGPQALAYTWQIDGETQFRVGEHPCVGDLSEGTYTATVFANDGFHAVSDSLVFEVADDPTVVYPGDGGESGDGGEENTDTGDEDGASAIVVEVPGCDNETVATDISVDDGVAAGDDGFDDIEDGDSGGDGGIDDDMDEPEITLEIDLDADDSSGEGGSDFATTFTLGNSPVSIADTDLSILGLAEPGAASVTIRREDSVVDDELEIDESEIDDSVIETFTSADSVMFNGKSAATAADLAAAIQAVTFTALANSPPVRTIRITITDGDGMTAEAFTLIAVSD